MKLLLTSAGVRNKTIKNALVGLLDKKIEECIMVYIPTAANTEEGDKGWLIDDLKRLKDLNLAMIDIVDISALPRETVLKRFEQADILVFGGGNTFHLMHWLEKQELRKELREMLKTKVFIGISAGSMVATSNLILSDSKRLYEEYDNPVDNLDGLGFVDFHIRPHFNSSDFPNVDKENLTEVARDITEPVYGIDDQTAIVIEDGKIEVVSEGKWEKFD